MKFRAERSEFADAAAWSVHTVGARADSTDLELSSRLVLPVQAEAEGTALVPGYLLRRRRVDRVRHPRPRRAGRARTGRPRAGGPVILHGHAQDGQRGPLQGAREKILVDIATYEQAKVSGLFVDCNVDASIGGPDADVTAANERGRTVLEPFEPQHLGRW